MKTHSFPEFILDALRNKRQTGVMDVMSLKRLICLLAATVVTTCLAQPVTNAPPAAPVAGYLTADFDHLASFDFNPPEKPDTNQLSGADVCDKQIPAAIKALDKKKVTVRGFMLPTKMEKDKTTEFLIMRNQMGCCFGGMPLLTEFVTVTIPKGIVPIMDELVTIKGTFHVGTMRDAGYVVGVYRMDGEAMIQN